MIQPKKLPQKIQYVMIMRTCRDGSFDYHIPKTRAQELYDEGKLGWDITNNSYCSNVLHGHIMTTSEIIESILSPNGHLVIYDRVE